MSVETVADDRPAEETPTCCELHRNVEPAEMHGCSQ